MKIKGLCISSSTRTILHSSRTWQLPNLLTSSVREATTLTTTRHPILHTNFRTRTLGRLHVKAARLVASLRRAQDSIPILSRLKVEVSKAMPPINEWLKLLQLLYSHHLHLKAVAAMRNSRMRNPPKRILTNTPRTLLSGVKGFRPLSQRSSPRTSVVLVTAMLGKSMDASLQIMMPSLCPVSLTRPVR